jgi:hypothetical protein
MCQPERLGLLQSPCRADNVRLLLWPAVQLIKCTASGSRLELEFIVIGSARFKVSAAALGFSTSSTEPATSMPAAAPAAAASSSTAAGAARSASAAVASVDEQEEWQLGASEPVGMAGRRCQSGSEAMEVGTATWGGCSSTGDEAVADAAADTQHQHQQHQQQAIELGSTPPVSSSSFIQWRSLRRSSSGGSGSLGRRGSYMRSLGSSVVEGALRSRLVKTDDGEYWVNVESFTLQFRWGVQDVVQVS